MPDLTDYRATKLMFGWVENGTIIKNSHINLLPWIRLAKDTPEVVVSSRKGNLDGMGLGEAEASMAVDEEAVEAAMEE